MSVSDDDDDDTNMSIVQEFLLQNTSESSLSRAASLQSPTKPNVSFTFTFYLSVCSVVSSILLSELKIQFLTRNVMKRNEVVMKRAIYCHVCTHDSRLRLLLTPAFLPS